MDVFMYQTYPLDNLYLQYRYYLSLLGAAGPTKSDNTLEYIIVMLSNTQLIPRIELSMGIKKVNSNNPPKSIPRFF